MSDKRVFSLNQNRMSIGPVIINFKHLCTQNNVVSPQKLRRWSEISLIIFTESLLLWAIIGFISYCSKSVHNNFAKSSQSSYFIIRRVCLSLSSQRMTYIWRILLFLFCLQFWQFGGWFFRQYDQLSETPISVKHRDLSFTTLGLGPN